MYQLYLNQNSTREIIHLSGIHSNYLLQKICEMDKLLREYTPCNLKLIWQYMVCIL